MRAAAREDALNGPFTTRQLLRLDEALRLADSSTGLTFSVYVGDLDQPVRGHAEKLHSQLADPDASVLIAVSPNQRVLEIVTGELGPRRIPDRSAKLAAMSMSAAFGGGDLAGGLVVGLAQLAGQAGHATNPVDRRTTAAPDNRSAAVLRCERSGGRVRTASLARAASARTTPSRPSPTRRRSGAGSPTCGQPCVGGRDRLLRNLQRRVRAQHELLSRLAVPGRPDLVDDLEVLRRRTAWSAPTCAACWKPPSSARCSQFGSASPAVRRRHVSALPSAVGDQRGRDRGLALARRGPVAVQLGVDVVLAGRPPFATSACTIDQRSSVSMASPVGHAVAVAASREPGQIVRRCGRRSMNVAGPGQLESAARLGRRRARPGRCRRAAPSRSAPRPGRRSS